MSGCCVVGCQNRYAHGLALKFYRIPRAKGPFNTNRRKLWLQAIKRVGWTEETINNARVCSAHFISGEVSMDIDSPDFVPSVFAYTAQREDPQSKLDGFHCKRRRDESTMSKLSKQDAVDAALKEVLRNTLDNFTGADFRRFKHHLRDLGQIPWRQLGNANTDDTVDLLVQLYTSGAGGIMLSILQKMNHNQLAKDLERDLGKCNYVCYDDTWGAFLEQLRRLAFYYSSTLEVSTMVVAKPDRFSKHSYFGRTIIEGTSIVGTTTS
ncbi:hypothetical protein ACEWY4_006138 [Coilia grayii]|uniref:THAP domain-containing protein 1 n=1 Tax=Coilia grayii TaxID=363190 RepID=A0ABD1KD45_9TELE